MPLGFSSLDLYSIWLFAWPCYRIRQKPRSSQLAQRIKWLISGTHIKVRKRINSHRNSVTWLHLDTWIHLQIIKWASRAEQLDEEAAQCLLSSRCKCLLVVPCQYHVWDGVQNFWKCKWQSAEVDAVRCLLLPPLGVRSIAPESTHFESYWISHAGVHRVTSEVSDLF